MELRELYKELSDFNESYRTRLRSEMARILMECGLDKDVEVDGMVGVIKIESDTYSPNSHSYKFYPYKKDGIVSQKSSYVGSINYFGNYSNEKIKEQLLMVLKPHNKES